MRAKKILIVIDILLILATVVFIISNSAISSEKSNNTSEGVTDKVVESVKPLKDAIEQEKVDKEDIHKGVRKIAHVLEYALLGAELMAQYGVDSQIGRTVAVMLGSTETTFYTVSVYFGAAGIRKTRYTIPAALIADFTGFFMASFRMDRTRLTSVVNFRLHMQPSHSIRKGRR